MTTTVTILGCGSSSGTPAIGCQCPTCTSDDPKNRRTRASSLVSVDGVHLLIDTGPDLRQQALRERLTRVDAVLYTHPHADHLNGIDDLRAFCYLKKGPITLYGNRFMLDNIRERLMLFYDLEAGLEIEEGGGRYRVRIRLPFRSTP